MDVTEQLRAWGAAHAQARSAESAALQGNPANESSELQRQAKSLRERADQLHREIYRSLDRRAENRQR
ncbi:MAG TPA: hypothetical protein VHL79_16220 [Ramlibacter sp.]|jgi:F0F1-type ATP synthase membrane subunit b/b'|nr:hypothetical protein [Ramlibacter sp.]